MGILLNKKKKIFKNQVLQRRQAEQRKTICPLQHPKSLTPVLGLNIWEVGLIRKRRFIRNNDPLLFNDKD